MSYSNADDDDDEYSPTDVKVSSVVLRKEVNAPSTRNEESATIEPKTRASPRTNPAETVQCSVENHHVSETHHHGALELHEGTKASFSPVEEGDTSATAAHAMDGRRLRLHALKGPVRVVCLTPNGKILCAGGDSGEFAMWDFDHPPESARVCPTRVLTPFVNRVTGLQAIVAAHASLDGSYFVVCQDGDRPAVVSSRGAQLGFCAMGERGLLNVTQCKGHRAPVTDSSPHGSTAGKFFTASQDGTARMWDHQRFTAHSSYAVQHGSGELDEHVVVESICSLPSSLSVGGESFLTGGQDGMVQLWDARVKYRPGGAVAMWDACRAEREGTILSTSKTNTYSDSTHFRRNMSPAATMTMMMEEKHVGGIAVGLFLPSLHSHEEETEGVRDSGKGSSPVVMVRVGDQMRMIDLRQCTSGSSTAASSVVVRGNSAVRSTLPIARGGLHCGGGGGGGGKQWPSATLLSCMPTLPFSKDTTPLTTSVWRPYSFFTTTSRKGFQNMVGGHVVEWQVPAPLSHGDASLLHPKCEASGVSSWCAGRPDEDVLCVAVDPSSHPSSSGGSDSQNVSAGVSSALFAGLSSGDVVVRFPPPSLRSVSPFARWWDSRPCAASVNKRNSDRQVGQKSWREDMDSVGLF